MVDAEIKRNSNWSYCRPTGTRKICMRKIKHRL